jgi:UDP-N-acetylmuramate: L-alanyl-gamma-D-glutamyl-meso-diaminopimelate ligase
MRLGHHNASLSESLEGADKVFVYVPPDMSESLAAALAPLGDRVVFKSDYDGLVQAMAPSLKSGDIVVFMSNGGFGGARQTLTALLKRLRSE